ncbi:MAG: peptidase S41, partial [Muribaculaceae bacterium]|nr:peptidase S41 [Muribaculaceae bacterium]
MNLRSFILSAALFMAFSVVADNKLTPVQKAAIATRFASEVKYNFAEYDRFGLDFDSICRSELLSLTDTQTDEEFGQKLTLLANRLGDGHTSISWSADVAVPPFLQKRIGDRVFVTEVFSDEYSDKGISRGTEMLEIDGMPVIEYGEKNVVPYIPSSTPQWSAYYPFSSVNLTKGARGVPVTFTFRNRDGKKISVTDRRESPWSVINPDMSVRFDTLPGNIGLLKIPSFRANSFDVRSFVELFEQKIIPTDGLIIDIRDNNGGNSEVGDFIMQLIATDTIPQAAWETPEYEAAYASWGKKWHTKSVEAPSLIPYYMQYPDVSEYNKPIVLLVNSGTFSSAEDFAVLFRNTKRGKIVGTATGGSTGNPIVIDLGWGYYGMICTRKEKMADGTEFIGIGIEPDIIEEETEE